MLEEPAPLAAAALGNEICNTDARLWGMRSAIYMQEYTHTGGGEWEAGAREGEKEREQCRNRDGMVSSVICY